jgi:hypothetical protein
MPIITIALVIIALVLVIMLFREGLADIIDSARVLNQISYEAVYASDEKYLPRLKQLRRRQWSFAVLAVVAVLAFATQAALYIQEMNLSYSAMHGDRGLYLLFGCVAAFFAAIGMAAGATVHRAKSQALRTVWQRRTTQQ